MRRFLTVALLLFIAPFTWATEYHVRGSNGSDTTCDGLADAPAAAPVGGHCNFAGIQKGIDVASTAGNVGSSPMCQQGHSVTVHEGSYLGSYVIPVGCQPGGQLTGTGTFFVRGDPAVSRDLIVVTAAPGSQYTFRSIGGGSSARSYRVGFEHMNVVPGTKYGIWFDNQHVTPTVLDVHFSNTAVNGICCSHSAFPDVALIATTNGEYPNIQNNRADGDNIITRSGVDGTDAIFAYLNGIGAFPITYAGIVKNNIVRGMLGSFISGNPSYLQITENDVLGSVGIGDDGALIQIYRTAGPVIWKNKFQSNIGHETYGFGRLFSVRVNSAADVAYAYIFNNTIVGFDSTAFVDQRKGILHRLSNSPGVFNANNPGTVFQNNLVIRNNGKNTNDVGTQLVAFTWCTANADIVDWNWYWDNAWNSSKVPNNSPTLLMFTSTGQGCPASTTFNTHSTVAVDPQVVGATGLTDATWAPLAGSPLCNAGSTSFTAPNGVTSESYIGYSFGACAAVVDRTLTVAKTGNGSGDVVSSPAGINCVNGSGVCSFAFPDGTPIVLTRTPTGQTSVNGGWSGAGCSDSFTITSNMNCTVSFIDSCDDDVQGPGEADVDCAGLCPLCINGKTCTLASHCESNFCDGTGHCATAPSCSDTVKNQDEKCVDGGGVCGATCDVGDTCEADNSACISGFCDTAPNPDVCATPPAPPSGVKVVGVRTFGVGAH